MAFLFTWFKFNWVYLIIDKKFHSRTIFWNKMRHGQHAFELTENHYLRDMGGNA